uniref:Nucleoprotein n=1 Tax=Soybean thrips rhabdo-like virus 3 TaxID=2796570 RepID=A0A7T3R0J2_9RHAB|nr:putative nucleoprotein [Soybean thrips rhabdo-like virus 3]
MNLAELDKLDKLVNSVEVNVSSGLSGTAGEWNDSIPLEMAKGNPFSKVNFFSSKPLRVVMDFLRFYSSGSLPAGVSSQVILTRAISLACVKQGPDSLVQIWKDTKAGNSFYEFDTFGPASFKAVAYEPVIYSDTIALRIIAASGAEGAVNALVADDEDISKAFLKEVAGMIKYLNEHKGKEELVKRADTAYSLYNMVAFLAALPLRCMAKDSEHLQNSYIKQTFRNNVIKVADLEPTFPLCAPCRAYITLASSAFSKGAMIGRKVLAHFLTLITIADYTHLGEGSFETAKTFVKASALTHLEHNGLTVCSLAVRFSKASGIAWSQIAVSLASPPLMNSLFSVANVLNKFQAKGHESKTWWWSRVYDDGYFSDMANSNHKYLLVVLSFLLIEQNTDNAGIKDAVYMKSLNPNDLGMAEQFARGVYRARFSPKFTTPHADISSAIKSIIGQEQTQQGEVIEAAHSQKVLDELRLHLESKRHKLISGADITGKKRTEVNFLNSELYTEDASQSPQPTIKTTRPSRVEEEDIQIGSDDEQGGDDFQDV